MGTRVFQVLAADPTPAHAASFVREPFFRDVWTELAYEKVRQEVAPNAVPRLNALFAFVDPLEAFDFATRPVVRDGYPQAVYEVQVAAGTRWQLVDMTKWSRPSLGDCSAGALRECWNAAQAAANGYWTTDAANVEIGELLIEGSATLRQPISLLRYLHSVLGF
jgi:hypothetical protein